MSITIKDIISMKSFTTCQMTGFICAKNILTTYNKTCVVKKRKKEIGKLNKHMERRKFFKSVLDDFDKVASDNKLDLNYLKTLNDNNMPNMYGINPTPSNTGISPICDTYSNDVKFKYMVRKIISDYNIIDDKIDNKIDNIFVHPLVAIGVAIWISPTFGSIVKDSYVTFINGDVNNVKETIQNLNTGLINNFETMTNTLTNEVTMISTPFENNDIMAEIKDDQIRNRIQILLDEKNRIIKEKEDTITKLLIKLDDEIKRSENRFNELINIPDLTPDTLVNTENKLDQGLPQQVKLCNLKHPKIARFVILQKLYTQPNDYNFYVLKIKTGNIKSAMKKFRTKHESIVVHIVYIRQQPKPGSFWQLVNSNLDLKKYIIKCPKRNWFAIHSISSRDLGNTLNKIEKTRN